MTEFFVPIAEKMDETDEELLEAITMFLEDQSFGPFSEERIAGIVYMDTESRFDFDEVEASVGDMLSTTGERVEAILYDEDGDQYLLCTPNRGVAEGHPIVVDSDDVEEVFYFD